MRLVVKLFALLMVAGLCFDPNHFPINAQSDKKKDQPIFEEVAEELGLTFKHYNGMTGKFFLPEIMGSGAALFDYDNDGDPDVFLILLDAEDGSVLFRKNLTNYQTQPATYRVYAADSPAPLSPTPVLPGEGTQAPFIAPTVQTLVGNESPNTFNNLGWMTDGTSLTDGNNVEAGIDRDGTDGVDGPFICTPFFSRVCDVQFDPRTDEPLTMPYQNGEVVDTFYWTNLYHDRLYRLGFTEAAGNFQNNNFARGGRSGDRIRAEAQDSSSINNANFVTPPDGGRGRMQMYIFTGPTPDRSSGLEHDVLFHELTHGTSNRLIGNAAGLTWDPGRGMGEGWSDFYALSLLNHTHSISHLCFLLVASPTLLASALDIEPEEFYRLPGRRSLDALVKNAPDHLQEMAVDIVQRLLGKAS